MKPDVKAASSILYNPVSGEINAGNAGSASGIRHHGKRGAEGGTKRKSRASFGRPLYEESRDDKSDYRNPLRCNVLRNARLPLPRFPLLIRQGMISIYYRTISFAAYFEAFFEAFSVVLSEAFSSCFSPEG